MTLIGQALREGLESRGVTVAELAHATGQPEPTIRNLYDGKVRRPNRVLREALDRYFDAAPGTTFRICEGREPPHYPADESIEVCRLVVKAPPDIRRYVLNVLRAAIF